jgi:hypothetical protein
MKAHEWSWRHRRATSPVPGYLQPLHSTGPVRFDPTLQIAADIVLTHQIAVAPAATTSARSLASTAGWGDHQSSRRNAA